jgi:endonuclease/exonuclease/phosphatase family metal-dependent hydrolase
MAEKVELKIMSYNIWNYNEPWKDRRKLIVDTILEADPDVVGLQEIRDDRKFNPVGQDQARQIAERTGFDYQYQPAMIYSRTPRSAEGLCIMSRHPIDSTSYGELTKSPDDERDFHQRIVLNGTISLPLGALEFFVTHFSLSSEMRIRNAVELLQFVNTFNSNLPKFIVGDFNCTPDELPIKILTGMDSVEDQVAIGNLVDVWEEMPHEVRTKAVTHGEKRIDFIFMIPSPWAEASIKDISILNKIDQGIFASDHSALTTTINISRAS